MVEDNKDDWLDDDLGEEDRDETIGDFSDAVSMHPFLPGHMAVIVFGAILVWG
jgi:hypothetical protein